jgi:hypothetical protein
MGPEQKARKASTQALEVAFQAPEKKQLVINDQKVKEQLRNAIDGDAFYEAQIQLIT